MTIPKSLRDASTNQRMVWAFLVERSTGGGDLAIYDDEELAAAAADAYVRRMWPDPDLPVPADPFEAVDTFNVLMSPDEHVIIGAWSVLAGQ